MTRVNLIGELDLQGLGRSVANAVQFCHFLLFFPIVVGLYFLVPAQEHWLVLLLSSFYFYMVWRPVFCAADPADGQHRLRCGQAAGSNRQKSAQAQAVSRGQYHSQHERFALFKYTNFALDSVRGTGPGADAIPCLFRCWDVVLPIGISFHTFQSVGYAIDVYRGLLKPELRFPRFALFVMFFPQLVAGPIERAPHLLTQHPEKPTWFGSTM